MISQHISRCYKEQKVTATYFLSLFSLCMGQKEALTASMHGRMLSHLKRKVLCRFFNLYLYNTIHMRIGRR
ncbi:hypothetical protein BLX05_00740 [Bacillus pseudomycoides]|nr:hypothetical protein BLX05_00740 [Bacillus pseudomycoides]